MTKLSGVLLAVALVSGLLGGSVAKSFDGLIDTDSSEYISWMKTNLKFHENWYCSSFPKGKSNDDAHVADMKIRIAPSGLITHLSVIRSSGNSQADFSCLESLASNAPFEAMPKKRHSYVPYPPEKRALPEQDNYQEERYAGIIGFGGKQKPKPWPEEEAFLTDHPELKNNCYVMHLIPLGIRKHYPGLFTEAELNASSNLIAIKAYLEPDEALQPFLDDWQAFISNNKMTTKNSVLKKAKEIKARHSGILAL